MAWLREQLIERPHWVADRVGIPQIAHLAQMELPKSHITCAKLIEVYQQHGNSAKQSKEQVVRNFKRLLKFTGAKVLADLTTDKLIEFRKHLHDHPVIKSSATITAIVGNIKWVVKFGKRQGVDSTQLSGLMDRLGVLYAPTNNTTFDPHPISPDDFTKLVAASNDKWKAMLLLSLNACLYLQEVIRVRWDEIDLAAGTFATIRQKTMRKGKRIPRCATLWPETIAALKQVKRQAQSPLIFPSPRGIAYDAHACQRAFAALRTKANVSTDVTYSHIRDGAYTFALQRCEGKFAKVLAGHECGMSDHYVLRNPAFAKPACDVVHAAYFG